MWDLEETLEGAEVSAESVTVDGNIITGRGPALAMEFALTLVKSIMGKEVSDDVAKDMLCIR